MHLFREKAQKPCYLSSTIQSNYHLEREKMSETNIRWICTTT